MCWLYDGAVPPRLSPRFRLSYRNDTVTLGIPSMDRLRSPMPPTPPALWLSTAWLGVAILIVVAIGFYSYIDSQTFRRAAEQAEFYRVAIQDNQLLLSLLKDAETAQRGYLLTGEDRYLAPYNQALPEILQRQQALATAGSADARRMAAL